MNIRPIGVQLARQSQDAESPRMALLSQLFAGKPMRYLRSWSGITKAANRRGGLQAGLAKRLSSPRPVEVRPSERRCRSRDLGGLGFGDDVEDRARFVG
jgi:hypothetical protein